ATLGSPSAAESSGPLAERCILRCSSFQKEVFLFSFLPGKVESTLLNLHFDHEDSVKFSVTGPRGIHLYGTFVDDHDSEDGDDSQEKINPDF
ncbi:peptidyl-prolyl cis-trans isomerase FKBP53-like, partial [Trifolium medium]|nr:peptidyl-prolyl cis-trans isomerase FKBP53-like [Trifolium medium]